MKMDMTEMIRQQYGIPALPENPVSAMAYIPFQQEESKTFSPDQGFVLGTMFYDLNKPFFGGKCGDGND